MADGDRALAGLTVLEAADTPGAAFAASLLADFGAIVIVLEPPGGSSLRRLGGAAVRRVWWPILARNKLSLAVDPARPGADGLLRRLAAAADLLVAGPDGADGPAAALAQAIERQPTHPPTLAVVPPGHDRPAQWPWSVGAPFAAAASGMMALTGWPDGPPMEPEFPLAEYLAGAMAAAHALLRLRAARQAGERADLPPFPMHLAVQRMVEWQTVVATTRGRAEFRAGNRFPMNAGIANIFETKDGRLLACSAANESVAGRLLGMIGGEALRNDARFRTAADRERNMEALYPVISAWMAGHTADEIQRLGAQHDVVVGPIYRTGDLFEDAHVAARADIVSLPGADGRPLHMPAVLPRMSGIRTEVDRLGPEAGADAAAILARLGLAEADRQALMRDGSLWA